MFIQIENSYKVKIIVYITLASSESESLETSSVAKSCAIKETAVGTLGKSELFVSLSCKQASVSVLLKLLSLSSPPTEVRH